jgi:hypothetical protein
MSDSKTSSFFKRLFGAGDETPKPIETPPPPKREPPGKGPDKKEPPQDRPPREEPPERERLPKVDAQAKRPATGRPASASFAGRRRQIRPVAQVCAAASRPRGRARRDAA